MHYLDVIRKYWPDRTVVRVINDGTRYEELIWNELDKTPPPTKAELDAAIMSELSSAPLTAMHVGYIVGAIGTTIINSGNDVPQITQGTEIMRHIVKPNSENTKFSISSNFIVDTATRNRDVVVAVFRDTTCIHTTAATISNSGDAVNLAVVCMDAPATTNEITYSIRVGASSTTSWYINTTSSGKKFGGTSRSAYMIFEHN